VKPKEWNNEKDLHFFRNGYALGVINIGSASFSGLRRLPGSIGSVQPLFAAYAVGLILPEA
jgi:hypothetical protein